MNYYKKLTLDEFEQVMKDIIFAQNNKQPVMMMQNCLTNGLVNRTGLDLQLCNNPNCINCQAFHKAIEEELKNISFKDGK